jgi:hypothetical protein
LFVVCLIFDFAAQRDFRTVVSTSNYPKKWSKPLAQRVEQQWQAKKTGNPPIFRAC